MHLYSVDACLGVEAPGQASFGEGAGQVWLDNTQCTGSEEEILDCSTSTSGVNSCTHAQDAGVRCGNVPTQRSLLGRAKFHIEGKFSSSVWQDFVEPHRTNPFMVLIVVCILLLSGCREGNVRLIGGSTAREGRVEFCLNSMWGTVCGNGWDRVDASIVCRQLGFSSAGNPNSVEQLQLAVCATIWEFMHLFCHSCRIICIYRSRVLRMQRKVSVWGLPNVLRVHAGQLLCHSLSKRSLKKTTKVSAWQLLSVVLTAHQTHGIMLDINGQSGQQLYWSTHACRFQRKQV